MGIPVLRSLERCDRNTQAAGARVWTRKTFPVTDGFSKTLKPLG